MLSNIRRMVFSPVIAVAIFGLLDSSAVAANQFTGAIYTTNSTGSAVNQNHYAVKEAAFLNGGPQHLGGPSLPKGRYYFQVTDSNGRTLLSSDLAVCRQVVVGLSGKIVGVPGESACEHQLGTDGFPGDPRPNDTPVQLWPFDNTNSGVYKVWLIAKSDDVVSGCNTTVESGGKRLNFISKCAKTDNFKVDSQTQPACTAWVDNFNQGTLDLARWELPVSGLAPGSVPEQRNIGVFDPINVSLAGGLLTLKLTQTLDLGGVWHSSGAVIRTLAPCGYGTYQWTMRMGSSANDPLATGTIPSGGVSSGLTYWSNSQTEIVFEHSAHSAALYGNGTWAPESIWFVNFHNLDPTRDPLVTEGTVEEHQLLPLGNVYNEFHDYKFVWTSVSITFYIDGVLSALHTSNVPTVPGLFMISYFGRNFAFWGGYASEVTRYFYVKRASYTPL